MTTQVLTPEFRVAFPKVFKAERNDLNGKDEYSIVALFPKGADLSKLKAAAKAAAEKKWGADPKKWPKNLRDPFRDQGDREKVDDATGDTYLPAGYEAGAFYLNLKSTKRPGLVDAKVQDIIDETDFYGGCYARAQVNAYAYDANGNRGISFGLNHIQKLRDGESFGAAARNPSDVFEAVGESTSGGVFD
jgi:hypothetical protein